MPQQPQIKFFLDSQGGTLAFLKEYDHAEFPDVPHHLDLPTTPISVPSGVAIDQSTCVYVKDVRNAVIKFHPSDVAATYSWSVYAGHETGVYKAPLDAPDAAGRLAKMDGYTATGQAGDQARIVSTFGHDWLFVHLESLSAGTMTIEVGLIDYIDED